MAKHTACRSFFSSRNPATYPGNSRTPNHEPRKKQKSDFAFYVSQKMAAYTYGQLYQQYGSATLPTLTAAGHSATLRDYNTSPATLQSCGASTYDTTHVHYGYRYYSLELGRWPSRDALGEGGGLNVYAFVDNQPIGHSYKEAGGKGMIGWPASKYGNAGYASREISHQNFPHSLHAMQI